MYLDRPLSEIGDADVQRLMQEMLHASGLQNASQNFVPFLILCQHPGGAGSDRIPFHISRTHPGFLETRIDKITSSSIHQLCKDLAGLIYEPLEMHSNRKLMTFLNHVVRVLERRGNRRRRN
jgi:hypothetical protein